MRLFVSALLLSTAFAATIGCEEDLTGREDYTAVAFTVYGVLSPDQDTQSVRVFVPENFPTSGTSAPLPIEVWSTDLATGEERWWHDTVLVSKEGFYDHVFWSNFEPQKGRRYRVDVTHRETGAQSYAIISIPPPATVRIDESDAPLLHVYVDAENSRIIEPEAVYDVSKGPPTVRYEVSYSGLEQPTAGGWLVTFNLITDAFELNTLYNTEIGSLGGRCAVDYVFLRNLELHALIGDAAWNPPGGVFDPNVLSTPNGMANVVNGHGFIGGGYRVEMELEPSRETVESACFRYAM